MLRFFPSLNQYAHLYLIESFAANTNVEVNDDAHHIIFDIGYCLVFFYFFFLVYLLIQE